MAKAKKFGAFGGFFTPSILTLLGVIMYLRLPWIVGQAGLLATLGIILRILYQEVQDLAWHP